MRRAAVLRMETSGTVTGLTTDVRRVGSGRLQPRMRGGEEIAHDLLVAIRAFFGADKFRARNTGRCHYRAIAIERAAGNQSDYDKVCSTTAPKQSRAVSIDPQRRSGLPPHVGSVLREGIRSETNSRNKTVTAIS